MPTQRPEARVHGGADVRSHHGSQAVDPRSRAAHLPQHSQFYGEAFSPPSQRTRPVYAGPTPPHVRKGIELAALRARAAAIR
eukprot:949656-Pleurochrysis_carterae.AAC.1